MTASPDMCTYCFDVLLGHLERGPEPSEPNFVNVKCALFVTWLKESTDGTSELHLRGCIGSLSPLHLHHGLKNYALNSALKDKRFAPISVKELPRLHCAVSLLDRFETATNYLDWEIGIHGLIIEFQDDNKIQYSATYLPEVASDQGWTKVECIDSLVRKAGYSYAVTERHRLALKVTRYQSSKTSLSYAEFSQRRKQVMRC
mmetsp:Transcript_30457/g.49260  ORF Transcript_30457/g.49260 Transcript_30457/m.49260 type:complete len:202 (-) Transcript_30457:113-718(-)